MSKTIFMDDLPRVHILDAARQVGGKKKLREWPAVEVTPIGSNLSFNVEIEHRPCRLGGKQSYFVCPRCGGTSYILLLDPATGHLRCRSDWPELRYRSQERGTRKRDLIARAVSV